jgi:hypothetical protein
MKDIMQKLAELEATAPKVTKKKMLNEDSTTPPMNVSNKPASLKDMFEALSESIPAGAKPLPVLDPQNKQAGMGFVTSNNPAVQNMLKALDPKDVQIVQAPGQPGQQQTGQQQTTAAGQPNPNQLQSSQQAMQEEEADMEEGFLGKAALGLAGAAALAGGAHAANPGKTRIDPVNPYSTVTKVDPTAATPVKINPVNKFGKVTRVDPTAATPVKINPVNKRSEPVRIDNLDNPRSKPVRIDPVNKRSIPVRVDLEEGPKVDRMVKHIEKSEKKLGKSKGEAEDIAWATANKRGMLDNKNKKKVKEGDIPSSSGVDTRGAGLGTGRSATTLEGKKPDFLDLDKDGNKKEPMKKAAADKNKKKVKESMNHRISAARLEGKSHGLRGHAHSGKRYEDLDEVRAYHEGYKEGLDECYGQGVYETAPAMPAATVGGMADAAMDEGNAFTAALAKTPKGGKFAVGGKTFTDRTGYDAKVNEYAFESLDQQLNALLNESEEVSEGLSVSISKGQQNSPDSVTITAQDAEAEHLLAFVKNAGLGLFGDDNADTHSSAMSVQPSHGAPDEVGAGGIDIGVVDGHDGMMGLMQKLSGIQSVGADDYADEEGDEEQLYGNHQAADKKDCGCDGDCECSDYDQPSNEQACNECGMMEAGHSCGSKEVVDEVETEDQMEFEVAEDNAPDSGEAESTADEDAEAKEDAALAGADSGDEEEMNESFASLLQRLTKLAEGSGDEPKHSEHDKKDDKDQDDAEEELEESVEAGTSKEELAKEIFKIDDRINQIYNHGAGNSPEPLERKLEGLQAQWNQQFSGEDPMKLGKALWQQYHADQKAAKTAAATPAQPQQKSFMGRMADKAKQTFGMKEEELNEWANNAGPGKTVSDTTFEQDIDFMTNVISGGLNKQKSTGQTTIPVIAGQEDRIHDESTNTPANFAKLAGIK